MRAASELGPFTPSASLRWVCWALAAGAVPAQAVAGILPTLRARLTQLVFTINMQAEVALDAVQTKREQYAMDLYLEVIRFIINTQHALSWVFDENPSIEIHFDLDRSYGVAFDFLIRKRISL